MLGDVFFMSTKIDMKQNNASIDLIIETVMEYVKDPESLGIIKRAYELARDKHAHQFRKSGEGYIIHPLEVAYTLALWQTGPATIAAGLLHDVIEDTDISKAELADMFDENIANLVDGVTKLTKLSYVSKEREQAENHRKMLLAMSKDIRVILIKLADRLHNIRTLKFLREEKRVMVAQETMDIYVPIAHRLGMYQVKAEYEDMCLRYLEPEKFYEIVRLMKKKKHEREAHVNAMTERVSEILKFDGFNFSITGRIKNIFSIYKKMQKADKAFDEIYDLLAIRLIVETLPDCYAVLGAIHANFKPIPNRFKDYIAMPKPNMYQSLHTTVISKSGNIYEIQIRTDEMNNIAEKGVAAHWAYKENAKISAVQEQREIQGKLKWYDMLSSTYEGEISDAPNLLELVKDDIFNANVYVFTPKGDVLDLPPNATPIDFAYRVHTDLGHRMTGAIVNGKIVPLTYNLKMGDVIDIKSNRNSFGPSEDWLNIVGTTQARHKIRQFFNKARKQSNIIRGEELFLVELKAMDKALSDVDLICLTEMNKKLNITSWDDLYHDIGRGHILAKSILERYFEDEPLLDEDVLVEEINNAGINLSSKRIKNRFGIMVDGLSNVDIKLAKCCYPVPGDMVRGYVTKFNGIAVHQECCPNIQDKEQFVDVRFVENVNSMFVAKIRVRALARKNILSDIIAKLATMGIDISNLNTNTQRESIVLELSLTIGNLDVLNRSATGLRSIKDVFSVERVIE